MKQACGVAAAWLVAAASAFAQAPPGRPGGNGNGGSELDYESVRATKVVRAIRISEKITIDGHVEEPAWKLAVPAKDFYQFAPDPGELSPEPTEVRFLYDDDNLYVAFHSWDSDMARRTVTEIKEDFSPTSSDVATLVIDSLHDRQNGYQFATNAAGAKRDSQISNDGQYNNDWDGVWDVKVTVQEDGWIAEFVIPFTTFRFSNEPTQEWGLNLGRKILRRNEDSQWAPIPIRYRAISKISLAGTLTGLENIRPGRNLKIKPYVSGGSTQVRTGAGDTGVNHDARTVPRTIQGLRRRSGYQVRRRSVADARWHLSYGFRAGGSGPAAGQPDAVQPVLSREARLLHRERRQLRLRRRRRRHGPYHGRGKLHRSQRQPVAVLQPPDRPEPCRHSDSDYRRSAPLRESGRRLRRGLSHDEDRRSRDARRVRQ